LDVRDCHGTSCLAMTHMMALGYVIGRSGTTDVRYRSRLMLRGAQRRGDLFHSVFQ